MHFSGFGVKVMWALPYKINRFFSVSFPEIVDNWYNFFLKYLVAFTSESWAQCFLFGRLLICFFFFFDTYRLREFLSVVSFSRSCVSRNCPFHLGSQICRHRVVYSIYYHFNFHGILGDAPSTFCPGSIFKIRTIITET